MSNFTGEHVRPCRRSNERKTQAAKREVGLIHSKIFIAKIKIIKQVENRCECRQFHDTGVGNRKLRKS